MKKHEKLLKHIVGEDGFLTLEKIIQRKKTTSVADPLELYLPLLVVPRAILSWLVQNIRPIPVDESKTLDFPGKPDIKIEIRKLDTDVYAGEFVQDGKIIHTFNRQTLPSLGGHLMTVGELYDDIIDDEKIGSTVSLITEMSEEKENKEEKDTKEEKQEEEKQEHKMIDQTADHMSAMTAIVGKLIDALIANKIEPTEKDTKEPKKESTDEEVTKEELKSKKLKEALKEHIIDPVKQPKDTYKDSQKEKRKDPTIIENPHAISKEDPMQKAGGFNSASGSAAPMKPKMPVPATPPGSPQGAVSAATQQTNAAMKGKQKMPASQGANKPIAGPGSRPAPMGGMGVKVNAPPKSPAMKEDPLDRTPNSKSYLLRKLKMNQKSEQTSIKYGVSEQEMLSKCVHCGVSEFTKSEKDSYSFTPCNCFTVMQKTESGRASWFVRLAKSKSGFNLHFNPKVDKESIRAFLLTLKSTVSKKS